MLSDAELEIVIAAGEDDKIERKKEVHLSDVREKAEFIRDVVSLVNAHGDRPAYLLIGVANDGILHDVSAAAHDDARFQQIVNSNVEPPVRFIYYERAVRGQTVGVIEISPSRTRFHVFSKDMNDAKGRLLDKGDTRIKRGSSKERPGAWDYLILREEAARSAIPQPKLRLTFQDGASQTEATLVWHEFVPALNINRQCAPNGPSSAANFVLEVQNEGTTEAVNLSVRVSLTPGMVLDRQKVSWGQRIANEATVWGDEDQSSFLIKTDGLLHGERIRTRPIPLQFMTEGQFVLDWTARSGNMVLAEQGRIEIEGDRRPPHERK